VEPLRTHHERQGRTAPGVVRTQGSLYVFAKLPEGVDDMAAIKYLSHTHKVCVLPGKGAHPCGVCVCGGVCGACGACAC
jgi:aspartate/methionine/tyrosine aminotransferase